MLTSGYETLRILLWITHILEVLLALSIQHRHIWARVTFLHLGLGGSKQNYSTSSDKHLVSMMQVFVIFGRQYCDMLVP